MTLLDVLKWIIENWQVIVQPLPEFLPIPKSKNS